MNPAEPYGHLTFYIPCEATYTGRLQDGPQAKSHLQTCPHSLRELQVCVGVCMCVRLNKKGWGMVFVLHVTEEKSGNSTGQIFVEYLLSGRIFQMLENTKSNKTHLNLCLTLSIISVTICYCLTNASQQAETPFPAPLIEVFPTWYT